MESARVKQVGAAAAGLGLGAAGFVLGRAIAVPGTTAFWDLAGQPLATGLAGLGAITAGFLAYFNGQKTRELDAQHHADEAEREWESKLRERYSTAAQQLADDNAAIREAGVYALAALTDDWSRYGELPGKVELARSEQQVCVNLLCSYLRANRRITPPLRPSSATAAAPVPPRPVDPDTERDERSVRSTITAVLKDRLNRWRSQGVGSVDLQGANLSYCDLMKVDLSGANLALTDLTNANLSYADLSGAQLSYSILTDASFAESNLEGAYLIGVEGERVFFGSARMPRSHWYKARIPTADLSGSDLKSATFPSADLTEASFSTANLTLARFPSCKLDGAEMADADLSAADLTSASIEGTRLPSLDLLDHYRTRLPKGFKATEEDPLAF